MAQEGIGWPWDGVKRHGKDAGSPCEIVGWPPPGGVGRPWEDGRWNVSDCLGKVSDCLGKVAGGLGNLLDGLGKKSDGLVRVSDSLKKV